MVIGGDPDVSMLVAIVMQIAQGYFVPLHLYKLKPTSTEEKMENMNFAFRF